MYLFTIGTAVLISLFPHVSVCLVGILWTGIRLVCCRPCFVPGSCWWCFLTLMYVFSLCLLPFYLLLTQFALTLMHNRTHSACLNICCTIRFCPSMNMDLCQSLFCLFLLVVQPSFTSTNGSFLLNDARYTFHSPDLFKSSAYISWSCFLCHCGSQPRKHALVVLLSMSYVCSLNHTIRKSSKCFPKKAENVCHAGVGQICTTLCNL